MYAVTTAYPPVDQISVRWLPASDNLVVEWGESGGPLWLVSVEEAARLGSMIAEAILDRAITLAAQEGASDGAGK